MKTTDQELLFHWQEIVQAAEKHEAADAITSEDKLCAFARSVQQDALQSLFAKLPDEEVKRIAKDTSYWISCIDGIDRTIRIKAAIEQAIHSAISLVRGGDDIELIENKVDEQWLSSIGQSWKAMTGNNWDTMDGETREEGLNHNIGKLFAYFEESLEDKRRLDWLRDTLGDTRQASEQDIAMYQDDATHDYFVVINPKTSPQHFFGKSLRIAISTAMEKE